MKATIKLLAIYLFCQLVVGTFGGAINQLYSLLTAESIDPGNGTVLAIMMLLGMLPVALYLWKAGYINKEKEAWSPVSTGYIFLAILIYVAAVILIDFILSFMQWLPDLMESQFDALQSGWLGILCIAVIGPVFEELFFRGAIARSLLADYSPTKAIVLSALIFGVVHMNPIQIVSAFLIGLLLGWMYYKTASLIPCILIHVLNNSLSVYLNITYPDAESTMDLFSNSTYYAMVAGALIVFVVVWRLMNKITIPYPWKKETVNNDMEFID